MTKSSINMPVRLDSSSADFAERFACFLGAKRAACADIELLEATRKFDRLDLNPEDMRISGGEIDAAMQACDTETLDALKFARDRIEVFHARQLPKDERF